MVFQTSSKFSIGLRSGPRGGLFKKPRNVPNSNIQYLFFH